VSNVSSMYGMFSDVVAIGILAFVGTNLYTRAGSTSFNGDISKWDVSNVKNMGCMFAGATSFNQDISNWDVSNVETMLHMFSSGRKGEWDNKWKTKKHSSILRENAENNPTSFNQDISKWDVNNVVNMSGMFDGATSFNRDISNWNVNNVVDMSEMFLGATSFNQDISNWDVSNVVNMSGMFDGATSFNQDIGSWNVSKVSGMVSMFYGATSFNQDLSGWNVSSLSTTLNMFYGATSFNSPIGKWNLKSITSIENMFREATAFNQDISSWDVSNVIQMKGLFQDAISFNQDISDWKLNDKLPKSRTVFQGAKAFDSENFNPFNKILKPKRVNTANEAAKSLGIELTSEDKKTISKIKKLLIAKDLEKVDLGLELLRALDKIQVYETLLFDCKIIQDAEANNSYYSRDSEDGKKLIRNKMFTGTKAAQPFLDYALLNLIADARKGAKVDDSIDKENITFLDLKLFNLKFDYSTKIKSFLSINKFFNLDSLVIDLLLLSIKTDKENGVDLEQVFHDNKISNLKVKNVKGNLNWLKSFQHLKNLDIEFNSEIADGDLDNFKFLKNLETLKFKSEYFENLDFLGECKKIKSFDLNVSSSSYSYGKQLENLNILASLPNLEHLNFNGKIDEYDLSELNKCKSLKHLSIPISEGLSDLKKCKSLETLTVSGDRVFNVSARIYQLNGLKKLNNLKKLSLTSFNFFGIEGGNLMNDEKPKQSDVNLKIKSSDVQIVESVIRYNALPFTGTVVGNQACNIEYEVVDGLKNGLYREYYETGKVKLEALYKKNKISKITGFYNGKGENILGSKGAIPGFDIASLDIHRLGGDSGGFVKNDKPYNGFCYIELEPGGFYGKRSWESKDMLTILKNIIADESFESGEKFDLLTNGGSKISLVLEIKQGIISNTVFLARSKHFAKITIADNYNFDRFPFSDEHKSQFMDIENEKHHRLEIYFHPISEWNMCIDEEKSIEIDEEVSPMLKDYIDRVKNTLMEGGKAEVRSLPLWNYIIEIIDHQQDSKSKTNLERPKLSSEDRKAFSEIKKQLTSRDFNKIDEGVQKLVSLNILELFENLLDGCEISLEIPNGWVANRLTRNKFFTGSSPAQASLDYALFCIIANAPEGIEIHESLKNENIKKLNLDTFKLEASYKSPTEGLMDRFIPIDNLTSLNDLTIDFKIFEESNKGPKNIDRSGWFKKSNITKLKATVTGSFKFFKNLAQLKYLDLSFGYYGDSITDLKALEYLENLEELKITIQNYKKLKSLDFIKNNKKLKKLNINLGNRYGDSSTIDNLDVIKNFNQLEELRINDISSTNLNALSACKNLKKLTIDYDSYNENKMPFDFNLLKNCNSLEELYISDFKISDSKALLSCKKLKELSLKFDQRDKTEFDFNMLKNCDSLETLTVTGIESYNLEVKITDFNSLNGLKNLKSINVGGVNLKNSQSVFIN